MQLLEILNKASKEELNGLAKILDVEEKVAATPRNLNKELLSNDSLLGNIFTNEEEKYSKLVRKTAKKVKVNNVANYSVEDLEMKIAQKVFEKMWDKMSPEQRKDLEAELKKIARENGKEKVIFANAGVFAALMAANLSGFGLYLLATTSLSAITGMMGIGLPFAAYTTLTGAIGYIIGPVGWIGAGLIALFSLSGPNYKKVIPSILYISMLRNKQKEFYLN